MSLKKTKILGFLLVVFYTFSLSGVNAQELELVSFEDIIELQKKDPRPIVVFLTAEWCTYCKRVENTSFKEKEVIRLLNSSFYFISFDIEHREPITLGETVFKFNPSGVNSGVHELAEAIGTIDGVLNTPTFLILNSSFEINYRYGGFLDSDEILALLSSKS